ncbi:Six-hairpin glycosidase [Aspergillus steynii IBT 23096]|uniref:Six-hairpin glycosidase n=1 Tax=Aspergillus steynii IBT 23096 TaxID=1392250 RepID=A0A2I2G056_9EURO|nr:Six-hairpin glycosidase [Aspergillus steynii IBT 23096]PLB46267.1 Six-hairpin glycosidase [Aspergillus steynii IBT 23096]
MQLSFFLSALFLWAEALPSTPRRHDTQKSIDLPELFSRATSSKIWNVAVDHLGKLPNKFPDNIPGFTSNNGAYLFSDISAWTSGFFPGSLYALLERNTRFPSHLDLGNSSQVALHARLLALSRQWSDPLHEQAKRTDTHDMGFLIVPALRKDWELTGNTKSLESVITAAHSLATRYDPQVRAIRSWDNLINKRHDIRDKTTDFLVIVDSMCNLDLLYYAGYQTANRTLVDIATTHAHTVIRDIIREDHSTFHLVNIDPRNNSVKFQETVQGYKDWSTWSRGQAWSILGYAQTYQWTKDPVFLDTAKGLADYFIGRLDESSHIHPYVPLWDFDAPVTAGKLPPRDTSAGLVAANGLLLLHQILEGDSPYLERALRIVAETVDLSTAPPSWESIFMNATISNNEFSSDRSNNTGLVYADFYFLEFGNRLLQMGLV